MYEQNENFTKGMPEHRSESAAKEDMAKLIARNMSMNTSSSFDDEYYRTPAAPRAAAPVKKKTASSGTKKKSTTGKKGGTKKKAKKKSKMPIVLFSAFIVIMICGGAVFYLLGMNSYKGTFLDNTYINSVDVSGRSQGDAYKLLKDNSVIPDSVTFIKPDGSRFYIDMASIGYNDNTKELVKKYYSQQDHYSWFSAKFKTTTYSFDTKFTYDKKKLEAEIKRKMLEAQTAREPQDAYITEDGTKGFTIVAEQYGEKVDESRLDSLYEFVERELDDFKFEIDLSNADCYQKPKITSDMLEDTCEKLNNLYNIEINLDFTYTTETLYGDRVMDWIIFNGEDVTDGYYVDKDKCMEYVDELAAKYDTYGMDRKFKSTNHGTITVKAGQGCYGWWIDKEKTRDMLVELIEAGADADTEPIYYVNPDSYFEYSCNEDWRTEDTDYSNTYIEVDLYAQHLWYYKNGKVMMESDIVSGYPNESRNTPEGVYKLWYKERGKTLVGESDGHSYASYVEYWNYVSTIGIGLHDASWQNGVFGGDRYKSSTWGSHGCINMPFEKAQYVYENIELGTPVFMYWVK